MSVGEIVGHWMHASIMHSSNLCGGKFDVKIAAIISRAVSEPEQKNGGLSHHPICKLFGTTISVSSKDVPESTCGRM